jgi:hypothetical protein
MKVFLLGLALLLTIGTAGSAIAPVEPEIDRYGGQTALDDLIVRYAFKYDVDEDRLRYIVFAESSNNPLAVGDMNITCKRTGLPVRARGILQLTECYYPDIPDSCAFDPECSLKEVIHLIKDDVTCKSQWTTCRNYLKV